MAVSRIDDIYLYTGWTANAQECFRIIEWLKNNNIKYTHLQYSDDTQHQSVFDSLNTWFPSANFADFPILTFTKMDLDLSPSQWEKNYYTALTALQADAEFLELSKKNS